MKKVFRDFMSFVMLASSAFCMTSQIAHANTIITKPKAIKPHFYSIEKFKIFNIMPGSYSSSVKEILQSQGWKVFMSLDAISASSKGMKFSGKMDGSEFHRVIGLHFEGNAPDLKAQSARIIKDLGPPSATRNGQMIWGGKDCSARSLNSCLILETRGDFIKLSSFYKMNLSPAKPAITTKVINGVKVKFHN
jgi:hypothetical protein